MESTEAFYHAKVVKGPCVMGLGNLYNVELQVASEDGYEDTGVLRDIYSEDLANTLAELWRKHGNHVGWFMQFYVAPEENEGDSE